MDALAVFLKLLLLPSHEYHTYCPVDSAVVDKPRCYGDLAQLGFANLHFRGFVKCSVDGPSHASTCVGRLNVTLCRSIGLCMVQS